MRGEELYIAKTSQQGADELTSVASGFRINRSRCQERERLFALKNSQVRREKTR